MTFVFELGIAAIANELETTMAVAVAAAMAAVMERIVNGLMRTHCRQVLPTLRSQTV